MIECICLVCHGPLRGGWRRTLCSDNCRQQWVTLTRRTGRVGDRYQFLRWTHAYRRQCEAVYAWAERKIITGREAV